MVTWWVYLRGSANMQVVARQPSKLALAVFSALLILAALLSWGGVFAFLNLGAKIINKLACALGFAS